MSGFRLRVTGGGSAGPRSAVPGAARSGVHAAGRTDRRRPVRANAGARPRRRGRPGLTLFEVIISISLIVMLTAAMLTFFWQTVEVRDLAAGSSERTQLARQVLSRLASELRGCVGSAEVNFPLEQRFAGDRRSITFLTTALPDESQYRFYGEFDDLPPGQHDLRLLRYALWVDPDNKTDDGEPIVGGILRTERRTLNQFRIDEEDPLTEKTELFSYELGYIEFRYFDGVQWDTKWTVTGGNSLPQLVQITVGFLPISAEEYEDRDLESYPIAQYPFGDDRPHPDRYSTIVRLPAASRLFESRFEKLRSDLLDASGVGGDLFEGGAGP